MARGREGAAKRARERARQERQAAKRAKRQSPSEPVESLDPATEAALMEEFRVLSERHAAGAIDDEAYADERHRLFVELGIEDADDG